MKKTAGHPILDRKRICRYILILFLLSLIPLLLIARYNHPCADDFSYGNHTVATWRETGSLTQTISAAAEGTETVYNTWQGSFAAVFFMTLHPAIFGEYLYALVPVILILGFSAATMLLLKIILMDYLGADKYSYGIIAIVITFLSMQFLISPVEAFFWYNGAMYYTGFHILSLVVFSVVLLSIRADKMHDNIICAVLAVVLSFLIGGGNFVTALTSSVIMALFFAYRLIVRRGKWLIPLLGLLAMCAALFISASAPGNAIRQEHFQGMNPVAAIVMSFWYAVQFVIHFVRMPVYFAFGCIIPIIYKTARDSQFTFRLPGVVTALLYGVYASTYTPNLYAMSSLGMARVVNVNYYAFLIFLFLILVYWCGWISRKLPPAPAPVKGKKGNAKRDQSIQPGLTGILAACFLLGCVIVSGADTNAMTSVSAARSLITGEARAYHEEHLSRLELYTDPEIRQVEVSALTTLPHVLYFDDITPDPTDWRNTAIAAYYNKDSVVLK